MRLPPITLREALALHQRVLESGGDILALAANPDDLALHLMAALVSFGAQLARDKDAITELMADKAALQASVEELNRLLKTYIDDHLARRLETDLSDEAIVDEWNTPGDLANLVPPGQIQSVEWVGPPGNYFERFPEINHELAKGISEMARQNLADQPPEGAIETTEAGDKGVVDPDSD